MRKLSSQDAMHQKPSALCIWNRSCLCRGQVYLPKMRCGVRAYQSCAVFLSERAYPWDGECDHQNGVEMRTKGTLVVFARTSLMPPKQKGYYAALTNQGDRIWIRVRRSSYMPVDAVALIRPRNGETLLNAIEIWASRFAKRHVQVFTTASASATRKQPQNENRISKRGNDRLRCSFAQNGKHNI